MNNKSAKQDFLPPKPLEPAKDTWRNIVGIFTVVVVIAIGIGIYTTQEEPAEQISLSPSIDPESFLAVIKTPSQPLNNVQGGDITFSPPEIFTPTLTGELPLPESFSAKAMIVKDQKTGTVLYKKNEYTKRPIASVTKLMSALVLLESYVDWGKEAVVVPDDLIDTHMYAGDTYTMQELWEASLIASSNKAIFTLADNIGWPREAFVERMNQKASELGMIDTTFVEPTGLNSLNVSTASDLVLLLEEAMKLEKIRSTLLSKEVTLYSAEREKSHHMWNTNWLLLGWVPHTLHDIRGGKTGFINASGYNFTLQVADEHDNVIDVIVLGANVHEARFTEARDVANAVFANYTWGNEKEEEKEELYDEEITN